MKTIISIILSILITFTSTLALGKAEYKQFLATAYTLKGKMANGGFTRRGVIAADPKVLPLGTKVHIEGYGVFLVADTGGRIKGRRIDIWMSSDAEAKRFGRRQVKLRVL